MASYNDFRENTVMSYIAKNPKFGKQIDKKLVLLLGEEVVTEALEQTSGILLPEVGTLRVSGNRARVINQQNARIYDKKVYHQNVDTGGKVFRFHLMCIPYAWSGLRYFTSSFKVRKRLFNRIKIGYEHYLIFKYLGDTLNPHQKIKSEYKHLSKKVEFVPSMIKRTANDFLKPYRFKSQTEKE